MSHVTNVTCDICDNFKKNQMVFPSIFVSNPRNALSQGLYHGCANFFCLLLAANLPLLWATALVTHLAA